VALKVLRGVSDPAQEERLRREARGLARQQHPNIVQVLGLGHDHGRTWIAMELVAGVTLAQWSATHPCGAPARTKTAVGHLRAVAEALAAAHAAGLVHRDVKPANVLVRDDGVVKLADFGLVRLDSAAITEDFGDAIGVSGSPHASAVMSRSGAVVGTPRYMSPEQHEGRLADARSDQFGFAVSAWEVLCGAPPFSGRVPLQILEAIESGRIDEGPGSRQVPAALRAVLRRGMAARPEQRFASMDALLSAWSRAVKPRGVARWLAGLTVAAAAIVAMPGTTNDGVAPCDGRAALDAFAEVYDAERQATVAAALAEHGAAWSVQTRTRLDEAVPSYGRRWAEAEIAACVAAREGDQAQARAYDRIAACREHAVHTTAALLARLEVPTDALAENVLDAFADLPDPRACGERDDDSSSPQAGSLRRMMAQAEADWLAGRPAEAALAARRVVDRAREAGLDRLRSEALFVLGRVSADLGDPSALVWFQEAHTLAMAHDDAALAIGPAVSAAVQFADGGEPARAREWLRHATVAASRMAPSARSEAELARVECMILDEEGRLDLALQRCEAALTVLQQSDEPVGRLLGKIRRRIENIYQALGRYDDALALATELRDEAEAALGPSHPTTAGLTMNLGTAAKATGDLALAEASFRRAEAAFVAAYGDTHRWVVSARLNLATVRTADHDHLGAEAVLEEALAATAGRRDAATARVLHNLAETRRLLGELEDALALLERVRVIEDAKLPAGHLQTAFTHHTRGNVLMDLGRIDEAERELLAAQDLWHRSGRTEHADLELSLARLQTLREADAGGAAGAPPRAPE
jgi:eukaryotic-like serine/threonine-protein kinase